MAERTSDRVVAAIAEMPKAERSPAAIARVLDLDRRVVDAHLKRLEAGGRIRWQKDVYGRRITGAVIITGRKKQ